MGTSLPRPAAVRTEQGLLRGTEPLPDASQGPQQLAGTGPLCVASLASVQSCPKRSPCHSQAQAAASPRRPPPPPAGACLAWLSGSVRAPLCLAPARVPRPTPILHAPMPLRPEKMGTLPLFYSALKMAQTRRPDCYFGWESPSPLEFCSEQEENLFCSSRLNGNTPWLLDKDALVLTSSSPVQARGTSRVRGTPLQQLLGTPPLARRLWAHAWAEG